MRKLAFAVVIAALFAGGCSDGGSSDISKADFLEKADKICADGNAKLDKDLEGLDPSTMSEDEQNDAVKDIIVPNIRGQISDVRDVGFPKDDADDLDAMFDDAESVLDDIDDDPQLAITGDPFADLTPTFEDYGFNECGTS